MTANRKLMLEVYRKLATIEDCRADSGGWRSQELDDLTYRFAILAKVPACAHGFNWPEPCSRCPREPAVDTREKR